MTTPHSDVQRPRRWWRWAVLAALLLMVGNALVTALIRHVVYERTVSFADDSAEDVFERLPGQRLASTGEWTGLEPPRPFVEVDVFDDDAKSWSNQFSHYAAGVTVFDANGDGLLDVYALNDGSNWTRPTDADGVLAERPRDQHNALYLHRGLDDAGHPVFRQVRELARANDTFVAEELLVENHLFPRRSLESPLERPGRQSVVAVAADLNADGRLDLLVGNALPGMFWSHPKTQRVLPQTIKPVGRQARSSKLPLAAHGLYLIDYQPRHNLGDLRSSSRGEEYYGANSLFLNLGDRDNDGLPEWRDASREAGIEGRRNTHALVVADFDLDGDLDVYEANTMDGDFWPGGAQGWAGGANQLYMNQLAESGELRFEERGAEMGVDGVFDDDNPMPEYYRLARMPLLPAEYSMARMKLEPFRPQPLVIDGQAAEQAQISWASVAQDVNDDGYPDIWVANDLGYLRLYLNQRGERFRAVPHARSARSGMWMSFAPADFDGDLREDLFVGNMGGSVMNLAITIPNPLEAFEPVMITSLIFSQFFYGSHSSLHALIDGADFRRELDERVTHSRVLPPDVSLPNNIRSLVADSAVRHPFDPDSLDAYEFAWGSTAFDLQNDGRPDLYYLGCLYGRGGGVFAITGTGPGRLLVNATRDAGRVRLVDLTAEHHVFNIKELRYDRLASDGYVYRPAPRQNWGKRDVVYSYDRSVWSIQGPSIQEKVTNHDLIQTAENGRAVISADFNRDGFADLLMRNLGGYDSRSSRAENLKVATDRGTTVLPPHDHNFPTPTHFEPGDVRLFLNGYRANRWIEVRLIDDAPGSFNRDAIGARVVLNGRQQLQRRCGQGGFVSNSFENLRFGLGQEVARSLEIVWPDRQRSRTRLALDGLSNGVLTVSKSRGLVEWEPRGPAPLERPPLDAPALTAP